MVLEVRSFSVPYALHIFKIRQYNNNTIVHSPDYKYQYCRCAKYLYILMDILVTLHLEYAFTIGTSYNDERKDDTPDHFAF